MSDQGEGKGGLFRSLLGHPGEDAPRIEPPAPPPPPAPASRAPIDLTSAPGDDGLIAALEGSNPAARLHALSALMDRDLSPRLATAASAALQDPQPAVRLAALRVIERAPRFAPVDRIEAATQDWEPSIRAAALAVLGRTQRSSVLSVIHRRLGEETEEQVIDAGLVALGQLLQTAVRPFPPSTLHGVAASIAQLEPAIRRRHGGELGLIARVIREDDLIELLAADERAVRLGAAVLIVARGSRRASLALGDLDPKGDGDLADLVATAVSAIERGRVVATETAAGFDISRFGRRADDVERRTKSPSRGDDAPGAPGEVVVGRDGLLSATELLASDPVANKPAAQEAIESLDRTELVEALEAYLEDGRAGRAAKVARLLTHLGRTEVIPFLARAVLELRDDSERAEVADALRPFADTWRVVDLLQGDPAADRRAKGLRIASLVDPRRAHPVLTALDDPHTSVRIAAIEASSAALTNDVKERLLEIVASDTSPKARVAALRAFSGAPSELRCRVAERALRTNVVEVRVAAIELLGGTSDDELVLLARALHDHEIAVAARAIDRLGKLRAPEALAVLWSSLRLVPPPVRELILEAMEEFDREAVVFLGRQSLDSSDASDRVLGLSVLARLESGLSPDRLAVALEDPSREVRTEALRNALRSPSPEAIDAVGARLRDPEPSVRALALTVLESIEDDRTLPFFVDGAKDPAAEVRRAAKDALLRHSSDAVVELLMRALEFRTHRRAAADLLIELGRPAVEHLTAALPASSPEVRTTIGEILDESGAQGLLVEDLTHRDPDRRMRAISGLGAIGSVDAVPALLERLRDPDASVRAEAARVLGALGDERAIGPLKQAFISDPDMEVVRAIEPALRTLTEDRGNTRS